MLAQKREGFTGIEDEVKPRLEGYAQRLGGELLDVQIREIQVGQCPFGGALYHSTHFSL